MALKDIKYDLVPTKEGVPSLVVHVDGREQLLHSRMFPSKEAGAMEDGLRPGALDACIVLGLGLGYHLAPLERMEPGYRSVILIDVLPSLEKAIESAGVNSFLLHDSRIHIISGRSVEEVLDELAALINLEDLKGLRVLEHPASVRIFAEYYSAVKREISSLLDRKAGNMATIRAFGRQYVRNSIRNLSLLEKMKPVSHLSGLAPGAPALVMTPGPTLDRYVKLIARNQSRHYIIAVDSALPVCRACGIDPDFVVSVDPQAYISEHFAGTEHSPMRLVTCLSAWPWHGGLQGNLSLFCFLNSHPFSQVLEERHPGLVGTIDSRTGSVAGDALMLAALAGFSPVALCGVDSGFTRWLTYAAGTAYQRRWARIFGNRIHSVETSNFHYIMKSSGALRHEGIFTRRSFLQYRRGLESFIEREALRNLYHVDPPSEPLRGSAAISYAGFLEEHCPEILDKKNALTPQADQAPFLGELMDMGDLRDLFSRREIIDEVLKVSLGDRTAPEVVERYRQMLKKLF
jgi:hypothetical protein